MCFASELLVSAGIITASIKFGLYMRRSSASFLSTVLVGPGDGSGSSKSAVHHHLEVVQNQQQPLVLGAA